MLKTLKKFFAFCGVDNRRLFITSIWLGVVSAICSAMRIPAAAIVIQALLERNVTMATLWTRRCWKGTSLWQLYGRASALS